MSNKLLSYFKRILRRFPPTEWKCGASRGTDLIGTLETGTSSVVSRYHEGSQVWSRDVAAELHEYTCFCLEQLFAHYPGAIELPVFCDRPAESLDPAATAMYLAERHPDSSSDTLTNFTFSLPESFADALEHKRKWLRGDASASELEAVTDQVLRDTRYHWPSSFCLRVNAFQATCWCVHNALNLEFPWLGAAGCARTTASAVAALEACSTVDCNANASRDLIWEGALIDGDSFGRGVGCPQAFHSEVESKASQVFHQVQHQWMGRLSSQLESDICPNEDQICNLS